MTAVLQHFYELRKNCCGREGWTEIEGSTRGPRGPKKRQKVEKSFVEGRTSRQGGSGEKEMELKHFTKVEEGGKEKFCRRKCKQVGRRIWRRRNRIKTFYKNRRRLTRRTL